jgi:hypothetical protein
MKIKTNLRAGMSFEECDAQRNYWKQAAQTGNCAAIQPPKPPTPPPTTAPSTTTAQSNCSWVGGVYYPDMSGTCL